MPNLRLIKHIPVKGTITCLTGLRIGGTKEDIEIGGMDNPIIRHPVTREPYIPGSSLKGKLRSTLEYAYGKVGSNGNPCGCTSSDCPICTLFGPHIQGRRLAHDLGPTRLLVRDATLIAREDGHDWVEIKTENMIDRRTGAATNPRPSERVAAGTQFHFEISVRIFDGDDEPKFKSILREGLSLIEKEYLGASGSRGYGQVKFTFEEPSDWRETA
jgi:CRISPR-associated protein Csm3